MKIKAPLKFSNLTASYYCANDMAIWMQYKNSWWKHHPEYKQAIPEAR